MDSKTKLAVGLGIGMLLLVIGVIVGMIICLTRKKRRLEDELEDY